jgi:uncharacterized protein involved in outer membrane biogenesis
MRKWLIAAGLGVPVLAAGALATLPSLLLEARLRAAASALIAGAFDAPVTVAGPVRLVLLPVPRLAAENVRIGAPGEGPGRLAAGRLSAALDPLPLLGGTFRFTELALERATLSLTLAPDGSVTVPWPERIETPGRLTVSDGTIHLEDAATGRTLTLAGLAATLRPTEASGTSDLAVTLADPSLAAGFAGRVTGSGIEGRLTARGAALAGEARLAAVGGRIALDEARLTVGGTALAGSLAIERGRERPRLTGRVALDRLDLDAALDQLGTGTFAALTRRLDAVVSVEARAVTLAGFAAGPSALEVALDAGRLGVEIRELGLYGGRLVGRLGFTPGEGGPRLDTALDLRGVALGPLMAEAGLGGVSGVARGDLALVAQGGTAADLLASLDGRGSLVVENAAWGAGVEALRLALTLEGRDRPLLIESGFNLNGRPVRLIAAAGPAGRFVSGGALGAEAELSLGGARLHLVADGTSRPFAARGRLRFETRDLADFLAWLGVEADALGVLGAPARVDGQLSVTAQRLDLEDAQIEVADGVATGRLQVDRSGDRPRLAGAFSTEAADLRRLLQITTASDGQALRALDFQLALTAAQSRFGGLAFGRTVLAARLEAGTLTAEARDVPFAAGQATLSVRVDAADPATPATAIALDLAGVDAATLYRGVTGQALDALAGLVSGRLALRGPSLGPGGLDLAAELTLAGGTLSLPGFDTIPVEALRVVLTGLDAPAEVAGTGQWRGDALAIEGRIGNPRAALSGGDAEVALSLRGERFAAQYDGTVTSPVQPPAAPEAPAAPASPPAVAAPAAPQAVPPPAPTAAAPPPAPPAAPPGPALRLALLADGGEVRAGRPVGLSVTPERDGHIACFYESASGDVLRIYPNPARPDSAVTSGTAIRIPDPSMGFEIVPATEGARIRFACAHGAEPVVERLPEKLRAALTPLGARFETVMGALAALPGVATEMVAAEVAPARVVTRTVAPPPPPRLTTDLGDTPVARVGTAIVLHVTAPEDGHLACFWRFGDGSLMRVLPNAHAPDSAVAGGRTVDIPGPGWPFQIVPETAGAEEQVVCLFARTPVLALLPDDLASADLAPLADPDVDRLVARAGAIDGISAARLAIRVAPR